jgi:hypothetical protein
MKKEQALKVQETLGSPEEFFSGLRSRYENTKETVDKQQKEV